MSLSSIIKGFRTFQRQGFVKTVDEVLNLMRRENGETGNLPICGHLVTLEPKGETLVVGDLHGDLESLLYILANSGFVRSLFSSKDNFLIFLGDYGDRGPNSAEIYYIIMKLKLAFPKQVVLLRGNHEGPDDLQASPHDLPLQFQVRFKDKWKQAYGKVRELFACLFNAVLVKGRFLMVHGGLSPNIKGVEDLARAHVTHPKQEFLEHLLWSDPSDRVKTVLNSPRGAGKLFGKSVTEMVLKKLGVQILVRGHQSCENGFKLNHEGKVLTLFSRKGYPYFNRYGAYLRLPLADDNNTADQLVPWIKKF
jgi:protein phosphatase